MTSAEFPVRGAQVRRKADGLLGEVYASDPNKDLLTVRWLGRQRHNTLVCTSEQFFRDWDLTGSWKPIQEGFARRAPIFVVVTALIVACVYGCASFSGCFEFKYPASVIDHKTSVVNGSTELDVTIKLEMWSAGSLRSTADEMAEIVKHELKEGNQEGSILFRVVGDVHSGGGNDKYGNPTPEFTTTFNAFDIRYSMDDMRKVNWDNLSGMELLNLGSVKRFGSYGDGVAQSYCEMVRDYSREFCANF